MTKKIISIMLLMLPTLCWSWSPGPYVGVGLGVDTAMFRHDGYVQRGTRGITVDVINKTQDGTQGLLGTAFVGYGWNCGAFYLAGELNGNASTAQFNNSNHEILRHTLSRTNIKINRSWGVSALPGILLLENALIYARVGYADGSFDIHTSDSSFANASEMLNGLRTGIGIEKRIYKDIALRFEYSHIRYEDYHTVVIEPVGNVIKKTNITPVTNQFELDVTYRFC